MIIYIGEDWRFIFTKCITCEINKITTFLKILLGTFRSKYILSYKII